MKLIQLILFDWPVVMLRLFIIGKKHWRKTSTLNVVLFGRKKMKLLENNYTQKNYNKML